MASYRHAYFSTATICVLALVCTAALAPDLTAVAIACPIILFSAWALRDLWHEVRPFLVDPGHISAVRRERSHPDWFKRFAAMAFAWMRPGSRLPDPGLRA